MAYSINKYYRNILGLDLRVSDLLRQQGATTEAKNIVYRQTGALSKREGFQISTDIGVGSAGLVKFNNIALGTGIITEEMLNIDDNLERHTTQSFTITYAGSDIAYYDFFLDDTTGNFTFNLYDNDVKVLTQDLGTGEGVSDTTLAQLKISIDAITDFTVATLVAGAATPVAFSTLGRNVDVTSTGTALPYFTWTTVPSPGSYGTPFTNHFATRGDADFEIASSSQMLDVLYITNGIDDLHKYDGNRVYKAGLPIPTEPTDATTGSGGNLTAGDFKWKYTFEHTDAKQNILTSAESSETTHTSVAADETRDITMTHMLAASGFGMEQAVVDGNQTSTTITVDTGHGLLANDQVYFKDSGVVSKVKIVSVTATVLTLESSVTVTDDEIISQAKISLWRTKQDGSLFLLEEEFINDNTTATQTYTSTNADTTLVQELISPVKTPAVPPKCRYIDVWRGQLVLTGDPDNVNTVYYSDFDGESFPIAQSFLTESRLGGGNSGIKSLDNSMFVFKPRSVITVTGDLGNDTFQVDGLADDGVGCVAHATIQEVDGKLWFMGKRGIYSVNRSGYVKESEMIEPKFDGVFTAKRAVAHYWIEKDRYMVQFPVLAEDTGSTFYMDEANSFIMVYDLYRKAWYEWDTINMLGGTVEFNGTLYTAGFAQDSSDSLSKQYTYKLLDTGTADDYADHNAAITLSYKTHWEAMGEPSIYKKFLRIKVHSLDGTVNDFETDKFQLGVVTEHDYKAITVSDLVLDFSGGSLGWGNSGWGSFLWGESRLEQLSSKLASSKAKSLRAVFTNATIHQSILISGYEFEIAASYDMQIKD